MEKQQPSPAQLIAYVRTRKGGQRKRDGRSFTEWKFSELCQCIGYDAAVSFAKYTEKWNPTAPLIESYKQFLDYENSARNPAAH